MQRKLYLVRHAQAVPGTALLKDEMRTLTSSGEAVSKQVGEFLKQKNSNLNLILASPAARTKQTSLLIAQQLTTLPEIRFEQLRQFMPPRTLRESLGALMALGLLEGVEHGATQLVAA